MGDASDRLRQVKLDRLGGFRDFVTGNFGDFRNGISYRLPADAGEQSCQFFTPHFSRDTCREECRHSSDESPRYFD